MSIKKWLGHYFESSCYTTKEFTSFNRQVKNYTVRILANNFRLISWNKGHFYFSAFFENIKTGKLCYIMSSDVRFFRDQWHNNLLIREVKHNKDYTGGCNNYVKLSEIFNMALYLTK